MELDEEDAGAGDDIRLRRMRWTNLGVVETIYEELELEDEEEEDSSSTPSLLSSPSLSTSPPTSLQSRVKEWSATKGRETDVTIHVQDSCFHLHKDPLASKSNYLKRLLTELSDITLSPPLKITAETFDLVADYCYGGAIVITPSNVAALRIAAELLEMAESDGENLRQKTETYFRRAIAVNREYSSTILRSCLMQMPEAETAANLVSKCIEAVSLVEDGNTVVNYLRDIKTVSCEDFRLIADSMHQKLTRTGGQDLLYKLIDLYFKEYTGNITDEQKMRICNYIDCSILSPQLLMHAVQNPRLPLRFVVQAMFIEQLNTRRSVLSAANHHTAKTTPKTTTEPTVTLGALLQRDAALRQVAQLKSAMDATTSRIQSLEKELSGMRQVVDNNSSIIKYDELESGRASSFRLSSEKSKVDRGQRGSSSFRIIRRKEQSIDIKRTASIPSPSDGSCDDHSSGSTRVDHFGRRLMNGLKNAFGVSSLGPKKKNQGGSKVDGDESESRGVIVIKKILPFQHKF